MIRTPLRPLARILRARETGENPEAIARENLRLRHEAMREKARAQAESRLLVVAVLFAAAFCAIGYKMIELASTEPEEPPASHSGVPILSQRADIVDRNGHVLATNIETHALYAQPQEMVDPITAAEELARIFPELDQERLIADFTGERKFVWIRRRISPEQMQQVHDIGEPGLLFGPREMRLYPNGPIAAQVLGGASYGREGVDAAEVIGVAGVERQFDSFLRDPANEGRPLQLSLDLTVQAVSEDVLQSGMNLLGAKGAASVLMDIRTGEVISMVSLPDFDPNTRPAPPAKGLASASPLFNRAVQGVYELGSTYKVFAAAQALDLGLVNTDTLIDTRGPMVWGRFRIRDFHDYGSQLTVNDVIVKSSNIGAARIALMIGGERQKAFLETLGLLTPTAIELAEAPGIKPLMPQQWSEISTMTVGYGHGTAASPLHLAAAYASVLNGGTHVTPTIVRTDTRQLGPRVVSEETSAAMRAMLRQVVQGGTATFANVPGYDVAGKTGTADKPIETGGGYYDDKVIATFASIFPAEDPRYVLVVTLDEPEENAGSEPRRTAGWTAVPVAAEMIRRIAPLMGMRPEIALDGPGG